METRTIKGKRTSKLCRSVSARQVGRKVLARSDLPRLQVFVMAAWHRVSCEQLHTKPAYASQTFCLPRQTKHKTRLGPARSRTTVVCGLHPPQKRMRHVLLVVSCALRDGIAITTILPPIAGTPHRCHQVEPTTEYGAG